MAEAISRRIAALIEDDTDAAEALALVLHDWGVDTATDVGAQRLANALGDRVADIAWIIADFDLGPGEDGVAVAKQLTQYAPDARVLVLSGTVRGRGQVAARAAGFDFMSKPAGRDAIIGWLERHNRT